MLQVLALLELTSCWALSAEIQSSSHSMAPPELDIPSATPQPHPPPSPPPFERRRSLTHHLSPSSPFYTPFPDDHVGTGADTAPTLRWRPFKTFKLFATYVAIQVAACARSIAVHPATALTVYPAGVTYTAAKLLAADHELLQQFEVRQWRCMRCVPTIHPVHVPLKSKLQPVHAKSCMLVLQHTRSS